MAHPDAPAPPTPIRRVTPGSGHYFFGYYDKHQWDTTGRWLLGMRATFEGRAVRADDRLEVGTIDLKDDDAWRTVAQTSAWCWQQGCMLQWRPGTESEIVYNDRDGDRFVAVVHDVRTGERRTLPRPVYTLSDDGRCGLSLNFARVARTRPGYGYEGVSDPGADDPHPADDGVWRMDLDTGEHELVVSIDQLSRHDPPAPTEDTTQWVNHLLINPGASRFILLHRWRGAPHRLATRMFTANLDGSDLRRADVEDASHFIWADEQRILSWDDRSGTSPGYYITPWHTDDAQQIGAGTLTQDGHITVCPDGRWLLTDEYPNPDGFRPLILFHLESGRRIDLGRFHSPMPNQTELRCDLHPRWDRRGTQVCIDSIHEGTRQMYVLDVSHVTTTDRYTDRIK